MTCSNYTPIVVGFAFDADTSLQFLVEHVEFDAWLELNRAPARNDQGFVTDPALCYRTRGV